MYYGGRIVAFVGPSSVGKTTLLEGVVRSLEERGLWVGVVKHSCHSVHPDRPGKDSARLYAAGAEAVVLAGANQIVSFVRRETPPRLSDALVALPPGLDLVLAEGFASEPIPRVAVLPAGAAPPLSLRKGGPLLRTVVAAAPRNGSPPEFPPGLVAELADELAALATGPATRTFGEPRGGARI